MPSPTEFPSHPFQAVCSVVAVEKPCVTICFQVDRGVGRLSVHPAKYLPFAPINRNDTINVESLRVGTIVEARITYMKYDNDFRANELRLSNAEVVPANRKEPEARCLGKWRPPQKSGSGSRKDNTFSGPLAAAGDALPAKTDGLKPPENLNNNEDEPIAAHPVTVTPPKTVFVDIEEDGHCAKAPEASGEVKDVCDGDINADLASAPHEFPLHGGQGVEAPSSETVLDSHQPVLEAEYEIEDVALGVHQLFDANESEEIVIAQAPSETVLDGNQPVLGAKDEIENVALDVHQCDADADESEEIVIAQGILLDSLHSAFPIDFSELNIEAEEFQPRVADIAHFDEVERSFGSKYSRMDPIPEVLEDPSASVDYVPTLNLVKGNEGTQEMSCKLGFLVNSKEAGSGLESGVNLVVGCEPGELQSVPNPPSNDMPLVSHQRDLVRKAAEVTALALITKYFEYPDKPARAVAEDFLHAKGGLEDVMRSVLEK